jgi:hypothetical protein
VGFWVEDSTLRYFHRRQRDLGIGSNCWEDWAQRQVAMMNQWVEATASLRKTPEAGNVRYRLDRIIVVGDGMLPMAGGSPLRDPDRRDDTVQVMVGFPAYDPARSNLYARTTEKTLDNAFYYQVPLVRQLGVLRYPSEGAMKMAGR